MFDLVTAVNTHNYWPNLAADMQEALRVLKPNGKLIIIGSAYEGGQYDRRNQKYAELIEIAFPSINELYEIFLKVGYLEVQAFEKYNRGGCASSAGNHCSYFVQRKKTNSSE